MRSQINPQRDPKLPATTLFDYLDKQATAATPSEQALSRQDPLVRAEAPGTAVAVEPLRSDGADTDEADAGDSAAGADAGDAEDLGTRAAGARTPPPRGETTHGAEGWAGEGRTGGWASPQRRVESWMSALELSQPADAGWGDMSSVVGGEKPSRRKSYELGSARPDSRGSVFSVESLSEQSLAVQRSTKAASWTEYCAALLRTGHCKHAAIGGGLSPPSCSPLPLPAAFAAALLRMNGLSL